MSSLQKNCVACQSPFSVEEKDMEFYAQVSPVIAGQRFDLPAPSLCPECRWVRKASYRNFKTLYHRKSDLSGKPLISTYSPEKLNKVYSAEEWWGDQWDPLSYGRDFDFTRPFFEQFNDLFLKVPQPAVSVSQSENCTYTNMSYQSKNCYLVFGNIQNEDCYYSHILWRSRNSFDMLYSYSCERCYDCTDCESCYGCISCADCFHCSDSSYLFNCRSSKNCYGCINLVNKEYCILNQQYSKEGYEQKLQELKTEAGKIQFSKDLYQLYVNTPRRAFSSNNCLDVSGNHLSNCKDSYGCFDMQNSEHALFCYTVANVKDSYDCIYNGVGQEFSYETLASIGYHLLFCRNILSPSSDLLYSSECMSVKNCFGCVGLHNREEYCILNKRYSKEEYEALVPRVIEHMKKTGEWGEFFPAEHSTFGYNESIASDYYPLNKEQALQKGLPWYEKEELEINRYVGSSATSMPSLTDSSEVILNSIFKCEVTGKPFKILPQELEFYKEMNLSLPRRCPDQRHADRMNRRNPRKLWQRNCDQCGVSIETSYAPTRPEKVFCEACYLKTVY